MKVFNTIFLCQRKDLQQSQETEVLVPILSLKICGSWASSASLLSITRSIFKMEKMIIITL